MKEAVRDGRTVVMGILNVTPDSFSDGGRWSATDAALRRAEEMLEEGADIIDIGGESTRPGATPVTIEEELSRVVPVVERLAAKYSQAVSVDTTKPEVARAALDAGATIINDISGLRFDPRIADEAARADAGLVLMHSRGDAATLHTQPPVEDVLREVIEGLHASIAEATKRGVRRERIVIDPGIGFGKTHEQNVELVARIDELAREFGDLPVLVGTSRKRFIGRLLKNEHGDAPMDARLHGTMATVAAAVLGGARIVRVHDVRAAVETVRVADAIRDARLRRRA